jgi:hypothetical protein
MAAQGTGLAARASHQSASPVSLQIECDDQALDRPVWERKLDIEPLERAFEGGETGSTTR